MINTHEVNGDLWIGHDVDNDSYIVSKSGVHTDWKGRTHYGDVEFEPDGRILCEGRIIAQLSEEESELLRTWLAEGTRSAGNVDESIIALITKASTIISDLLTVIETLSAKVGA